MTEALIDGRKIDGAEHGVHPAKQADSIETLARRSRKEAEAAVRTLIRWAGEDPARPGLHDTPARVIRAYEEWLGGYGHDPVALLQRTFSDVAGYDEAVRLRDVPFFSVCEHHMAPIRGKAHIAYLPRDRVVGISKLARVVEAYSRRLQIQERLTSQIANAIEAALEPRGVAVVIDAEHACMTSRGIRAHDAHLVTTRMLGAFRSDPVVRAEFLMSLGL